MINILLPSIGTSEFFQNYYFPKLLTEICGKTMLEMVVDNYKTLSDANYTFIFRDEDCKKFHLDDSVKVLLPQSRVLKLEGETAGAVCTCLMAIEFIDNNNPLVIANTDQIIEVDYSEVISKFYDEGVDAGVIIFPSIHPRWSYVRKSGKVIVEAAEKRPFTKDAIAGFYYFRNGKIFIDAAKSALLKGAQLDGSYYISSTINEVILTGKSVGYFDIDSSQYRSFYSPAKIKEYEESKR